jgi:hypothetical protein
MGPPSEISLDWQQILAEVLGEEAGQGVEPSVQDANAGGEKMDGLAPARPPDQHERKRQIEDGGSFTPPVSPQ